MVVLAIGLIGTFVIAFYTVEIEEEFGGIGLFCEVVALIGLFYWVTVSIFG
jgi:hypothetical protein